MSEQSTTSAVVGADTDLDMIFDEVEAFRELADDPDRARDSAEVYSFSIRWGAMMFGRLERLEHYSSRGELAPDVQHRYDNLRAQLRELLPKLAEFGVARPKIPLS